MSSGNAFERLFRLWAAVCKMVIDGKRSAEAICDILQRIVDEKSEVDLVQEWVVFYKNVFGLDCDFSSVKIPERKPGFNRLIIVAQGMTPQKLFDKCAELFPSWKYTKKSLDEIVISERTAKDGAYALWARDRIEADEENKDLSADFAKERGLIGETLEERLLHELKFFKETRGHLDGESVTLCIGSRYTDGLVPNAGWCNGRFKVHWHHQDNHFDDLRFRSAVPPPVTEQLV